ncbi:MAG TPA: PIN domain-containing protein [Candidatus Thermoplasmatota archaeon]|nr:PIN domain-containing protein [Candidatus Thermoplasmatota archaeon]
MKLVIDTNVLFSAVYDPASSPGQLLVLAIEGALELYAPATVRAELERVLREKLGYTDGEWEAALAALPVEWIEETAYAGRLPEALKAIADPSDAPVVALALALRTGVVSGDRDFHPLRRPVVKTWKPKEAAAAPRRRRAGRRRKGR